jgi:hypothetical protein
VSQTRLGRKSLGRVAAAVAVVLALSGCAGARPGVAIEVGDESIPMSEVDRLAEDFCAYAEERIVSEGNAVPQRFFRGGAAGILALRSVGEQLAEQYGVEPGADYDQQVTAIERGVRQIDEGLTESIVTIQASDAYLTAIQAAIGDVLLRAEGDSSAAYSEKVERGKQAFEDWISENGVTFDPALGVELKNVQAVPVDTSLSVPVGEAARAGDAATPDPAYAQGLTANQRCG